MNNSIEGIERSVHDAEKMKEKHAHEEEMRQMKQKMQRLDDDLNHRGHYRSYPDSY